MNNLNILVSEKVIVEGWGKIPRSELCFQNQYHHVYNKHMLTTLIICFVTLYIKYFIYMSLLNRDYSHNWSEDHCIITGISVLRTHTCTNFMFVFHCNPVFSFVWLHARSSSLVPTVCLIEYDFALWLLFFVLMNFLQVVNSSRSYNITL